ncbi:hypothetical protein QQ045_030764 [Rhodiola kirilowii]
MERNQILMKEKLGFSGLLKAALKILYQNPNLIILVFLTSLPLFIGMLIHELWFQKTLIQAATFLSHEPEMPNINNFYIHRFHPIFKLEELVKGFGLSFVQLGLLYIPFIHLPDLINTIGVVSSASAIYSGDQLETKPRETLFKCFENCAFRRPLITSIYVLSMASLVFLGFIAIASQACVYIQIHEPLSLSSLIFALPFFVLLYKYLQWRSLWNLGIVTSILEDKHGDVALLVSAYISRGNRLNGQVVTAMFFFWKLSLRLMATIYVGF